MKKNLVEFFLIISLILIAFSGTVSADYSFEIPKAQTTVEVESDGTMTIFIEYEIKNLGQKLDFIDIGLPNNNLTLSDVKVTLNGSESSEIKVTRADYEQTGLKYGISLEMRNASLASGESAVVDVWIPNLRKNLFDATSETIDGEAVEFAGFEFSPNYFSPKFTKGKTDYSFIIVFPPGADDGLAFYFLPENWVGEDKPETWLDEDGCVVYEWYSEKADMHTEYTFGGKFAKSCLISTNNIAASGGGSSSSSSNVFNWDDILYPIIGVVSCIGMPALFFFLAIRSMIQRNKENKLKAGKYFPPQVKTDGEGIKRGLTAVEAAILLETDLERVISMILYGLAKKDVIQVKSTDPYEVEIADPLPEGLYEYEKNFIEALKETNSDAKKAKMREAMHRLILSVYQKVEGFSREETKAYYKSICDKAWSQVEAADTPELKSKLLGDNFGWAMLDEDPEKKVTNTFTGSEFYPPAWWWRVDPGYHRPVYHPSPSYSGPVYSDSSSDEKRSGSSHSTPTPMPILPGAMFARSITDGARRLANSIVGNTRTFQSAVKNRTNPDPVYSSSSSSHRHGGGGRSGGSSCACACACDSCACACAGGGR